MSNGKFFTGELPDQVFGAGFGSCIERLGYQANKILWSGCIDAPDYIPSGATMGVRVEHDEYIGVSKYTRREI